MYKAIIFDLDGTLLNTIDDLADAGNYALKLLEYPIHTTEEYQQMVGDGIPKLVERMLPIDKRRQEIHSKALELFTTYYTAHSDDQTAPYEGILSLLTHLKESGYLLGVLTNKEHSIAQTVVNEMFPTIFTHIYGQVEGIPAKPDPIRLLEMLEELSVSTSDILYVGDSEVDMLTARNAKVASCGVLWGYRTKEQLLTIGASFFINHPNNLLSYLV